MKTAREQIQLEKDNAILRKKLMLSRRQCALAILALDDDLGNANSVERTMLSRCRKYLVEVPGIAAEVDKLREAMEEEEREWSV